MTVRAWREYFEKLDAAEDGEEPVFPAPKLTENIPSNRVREEGPYRVAARRKASPPPPPKVNLPKRKSKLDLVSGPAPGGGCEHTLVKRHDDSKTMTSSLVCENCNTELYRAGTEALAHIPAGTALALPSGIVLFDGERISFRHKARQLKGAKHDEPVVIDEFSGHAVF